MTVYLGYPGCLSSSTDINFGYLQVLSATTAFLQPTLTSMAKGAALEILHQTGLSSLKSVTSVLMGEDG